VKVDVVDEKIELTTKELPKHKKNPSVGTKTTIFSGQLYIEYEDAQSFELNEEVIKSRFLD